MNGTQELIQSLGGISYFGIFGISILANVFIPVPEEVVLLALGYIARSGGISIFAIMPIVMAGLLVSDVGMYILARSGNRLVTGFYNKFFAKRIGTHQYWIETHIKKVIFFSRFLMQLRFLGPFMAGHLKIRFRTFLFYELAALIIYVPFIVWIGWYFHARVAAIADGIGTIRNIILIIVGITLIISISKYIYRRLFRVS